MADEEKNPAAVELGKIGAAKRYAKMTAEQKTALAKKAARARWGKKKRKKPNKSGV